MGTLFQELRTGCLSKVMQDEMMFVLLARDPGAPELVEQWAEKRHIEITLGSRPASDIEQINEARKCAETMRSWRRDNDGAWRNGLFGTPEPTAKLGTFTANGQEILRDGIHYGDAINPEAAQQIAKALNR